MPEDQLWAAVQEHHDVILTAYSDFEKTKPIILLDIQEQRIYAFPYQEFKDDLSPRSQASLTEQYEKAIASNRIVVFVRDNDTRRLVSYTIDYDKPTRVRIVVAKKKASAGETKSGFLRKVLSKNIDLDYRQVNRMWAKKGYPGEISNALYYQIRQKLGIVTEWRWVKEPDTTKAGGSGTKGEVHQFKIVLLETKPPIWRRIQVPDCTLDQLHQYVQTAMGWMNSHLYDFKIDGQSYSDPMMMADSFDELDHADSSTTKLSAVLAGKNKRFRFEYLYDFGDSWRHEVLYEGLVQIEPRRQYPCCLEGERACPPEDVGGTWAYLDFLKAIADPKNPEHEELLEWVGGKFDPEAFSPAVANKRMKRGMLN